MELYKTEEEALENVSNGQCCGMVKVEKHKTVYAVGDPLEIWSRSCRLINPNGEREKLKRVSLMQRLTNRMKGLLEVL